MKYRFLFVPAEAAMYRAPLSWATMTSAALNFAIERFMPKVPVVGSQMRISKRVWRSPAASGDSTDQWPWAGPGSFGS
ncbi:hypothetical protein ACWCO9_07125 [Streptomyces sp. NPDC001937]